MVARVNDRYGSMFPQLKGAHAMESDERIVRYTAAELEEKRRRGEGKTDWAAFAAITDEELEAAIDHEDEGEFDLSTAMAGRSEPHQTQLAVRFDRDVVAWFQARGDDYQDRMNAVLRAHVDAQTR